MKKFLIADDHQVVRNGLKLVLNDEFSEIQFGEAQNSSEVLKKIPEDQWDILILDINMPGRSGLDVLHQMKIEHTKIPVLVLSLLPEDQMAMRVLRLGASGYISKDASNPELIKAIHCILSGKKYITSSVAEQLAIQLENPSNKPLHEFLSEREYQTLLLIAEGKSSSQIAEILSISTPTVGTYRARMLEKMHMKTNADLINYAIRHHLV